MSRYACTFTVTVYGFSGNELPPPTVGGYSHTVLADNGESEQDFTDRMQIEGVTFRKLLKDQFDAHPIQYSQASSCSWVITAVGSVTDLIRLIINGRAS